MTKKLYLSAAVTLSALTLVPASSEAGDCLGLHRVRTEVVGAVDGTARFAKRVVDRTSRLGERAFGWIFCDKRRV